MIGHIGRARKGPRANADLDEYSNYCRRSPERLVGVQLRGSLCGMDRRAHSRPVDCCSSRLHSSGVFCPAHRFGVEARCVKAREVRSPPAADGTAPAVERSFWPRACRTRRIGLPRSSLCSLPWFACSQYLGRSNRGTPQPRRDLRSAPVAARAGQLSFIIASNTTRSM
jgi:hypothetical protein